MKYEDKGDYIEVLKNRASQEKWQTLKYICKKCFKECKVISDMKTHID